LTASPDGQKNFERILIVRLSAMGDVIHTVPAVQGVRQAFPNATIGWLIEERWAQLLCAPETPRHGARSAGRPLADWVHTVSLAGWRKSLFSMATVEQVARVWNDVRSVRYDVAVDLQGAIRSAVLARWSGAPVVYGMTQPRETPASMLYTRSVIARGSHVIEQNLSIVEVLAGRTLSVPRVQFPGDCKAEQKVEQWLSSAGIQDYAIINPGAGWGAKRWPAAWYGEVARDLAASGLRSIVNYGPGEDHLASATEEASGGAARPLQCSITELIALTRRAKLFVGGDTGPLHLAAALQVPVVGIFGPTDPRRNGPYGTRSVVLRNPLSPTSHTRRAQPDEGMLEISVDEVLQAAGQLLAARTETARG
jgi:heptosyltransferase I